LRKKPRDRLNQVILIRRIVIMSLVMLLKAVKERDGVVIKSLTHFNLNHTFLNGQCFRWEKTGDRRYRGIVGGRVLEVAETPGGIVLGPMTLQEYRDFFEEYFDLKRDYEAVNRSLSGRDFYLDEALTRVPGLRILNQEPFETMISFIVSANNNIPRIRHILHRLSEAYGEAIGAGSYAFPTPEALARASLGELRALGTGYRDRFIQGAARRVVDEGIRLEDLKSLDTLEAKRVLLEFDGVGNKVAECILLFSLGKWDVFPEDTWVKKIVRELYSGQVKGYPGIRDFFNEYFGEGAGYAQQVLFHWARNYRMGVK